MKHIERLHSRLVADGDCWIYTGYTDRRGYGKASDGHGTPRLAHRLTYEFYVGPVPPGLELDHLCRRPACCNPAHLDPVTHLVNVQRGDAGKWRGDVCPRGHDLNEPKNLYAHTKGVGRKCRPCALMRSKANHKRKASA